MSSLVCVLTVLLVSWRHTTAFVDNTDLLNNGKPPGSMNRWNYNEVYKRSTTYSNYGGVTRATWEGVVYEKSLKGSNVNHQRQMKNLPSTVAPTPGKRVEQEAKHDVDWAYDSQSFYLRASADMRFKVRHAPIPALGTPWPMPRTYIPRKTTFLVVPGNLRFRMVGGESCEILDINFKRICSNMFGDFDAEEMKYEAESDYELTQSNARPVINWLNVTVLKECTEYPYLEMDESYDLEVKPTGASIIAREVWGALRGMETFSQLVYENKFGQFLINKTLVRDGPRFKHRGVLLDTSRHFLDKRTIIANLEAMAQNKMNVFHWHIVDDQSFPYESKLFPNLSRMGSYDAQTHIYSPQDIAEIIEEARVRGIRVIPEFDTPGHTLSWGYGQDHLLTPCYDYNNRPNGLFGPINPILRKTYTFLHDLFAEVLTVFKDKYLHLGGDEVPFDCWYLNPTLKNFVRRNNMTDVRELLNVYERKLFDIVTKLGHTRDVGSGYIVWQEVFDNGVKVKPDTIVQVWSGDSYTVDRITKSGLRTLFSTCWYLDYISYGMDWDKYYNCEHISMSQTDYRVGNESLLIGGEVCMWTEFADDDSVMPRIWPRASAAAERLWSDRNVNNAHQAAPRLEEHRCRMMRTGLKVGVLSGPGHCTRSHRKRRSLKSSASRQFNDDSDQVVIGLLKLDSKFPTKMNTVALSLTYWGPLLLVILLIFLVLFSRYRSISLSRVKTVVQRLGVRTLPQFVTVFLVFILVWILWTAPVWTHSLVS